MTTQQTENPPDRKTDLEIQIASLQCELGDIKTAERRAEVLPLIGRCYRYRNSSGIGPKWWLYTKITGVNNECWLNAISFERRNANSFHFEGTDCFTLLGGYSEISEEEYQKEFDKFIVALAARGGSSQ